MAAIIADPVPNQCILLRPTSGVRKKGKGWKEQRILYISKGELLAEIPKKEQVKQEEGAPPHNYCLFRDPDITLYDNGTGVSPIIGPEGDYLEGIKDPVTRLIEYQKEGHSLQWITDLRHGDEVFFKLQKDKTQAPSYPRGKVRYYGRVEGEISALFGIEITVSINFPILVSHTPFTKGRLMWEWEMWLLMENKKKCKFHE